MCVKLEACVTHHDADNLLTNMFTVLIARDCLNAAIQTLIPFRDIW